MDSEEKELLYRVDERLARIEQEHIRRLSEVEGDVESLDNIVDEHSNRIQRNETIIAIITGGLGTTLAGVAAKLSGFLHLIR